MAKVRVCIQSWKYVETEIDDKYIKLDVDRSASAKQNDTIYISKFVGLAAENDCLCELQEKLNLDNDSAIASVLDLQTDCLLYNG